MKMICPYSNENYSINYDEIQFYLSDVIPSNLCLATFHSIFPYIFTLKNGGWFNWVNHNEHVIVNCSSLTGAAVFIKKPSKNTQGKLSVEVMKVGSPCQYNYKLGQTFVFNVDEKNLTKLHTIYKIYPNIINLIFSNKQQIVLMYGGISIKIMKGVV